MQNYRIERTSQVKVFVVAHWIPGGGGGGWHISISLTGMLVREQISTTPKNRMTLISDPKNRMPQNSNKKK